MCRTYNSIGSLTTLKSHLKNSNIHDFKSLKEVMDFQSSFHAIRQQLISKHENLIEQEKYLLGIELKQLETGIQKLKKQTEQRLIEEINRLKQVLNSTSKNSPTNFYKKAINYIRDIKYKRQLKNKERNFDIEVNKAIGNLVDNFQIKSNRYQFISSDINEAVKLSVQNSLSELERKKAKIDELNSFIYGAIGEQKVVKTLEALPDEYFLINDFSINLSPAIYNKQENDYIKSIQIDHILVAPSGVFLIETKNWSEKSLQNLSLRSPVQQIKRTNFVLYKLLNSGIGIYQLHLDRHHWGEKRITTRNLIVLTNSKPKEEFQHVKILTLNELLNYVKYFKPLFSNDETQKIAEFIMTVKTQSYL